MNAVASVIRLASRLFPCLVAILACGSDWREDLYLGRNEPWRQRVPIVITNGSPESLAGRTVYVPADFAAGTAADALRVCSADDTEMLWALRDAEGLEIRRGPIPAGATLAIPVESGPATSVVYHAYFDNPAAWPVPDFLRAADGDFRNGGMELGDGDAPSGWRHDEADDQHRAIWSTEHPRSGSRCLKTVVAEGAPPSWIATRQHGIRIESGARYRFEAWVRGEGVRGQAGWYLHVGNATNTQILGPMATAGSGNFGWKKVTAEFTAPPAADRADLGTVLRGTGTAWFDDASLIRLSPGLVHASVGPVERHTPLREAGQDAKWPAEERMAFRFPVRLVNSGEHPQQDGWIAVDLSPALARLNGRIDAAHPVVFSGEQPLEHQRMGDTLLFRGLVPARMRQTFHVYFRQGDSRLGSTVTASRVYAANPALPGGETRESGQPASLAAYASLMASPANLLQNPSFEQGAPFPAHWTGGANKPGALAMGLFSPSLFGAHGVRLQIDGPGSNAWNGWHQSVSIRPGATYLLAGWVRCTDFRDHTVRLHAHAIDAKGRICSERGYNSVGPDLYGTRDWTLLQGYLRLPDDAARLDAHLTAIGRGTVEHDGMLLCEVRPAEMGDPEPREAPGDTPMAAWPVNPIVKVFKTDGPLATVMPARLSAARGERESLQIALRSIAPHKQVRITVDPPRGRWGRKLPAPDVGVIGYVPVDHPSNYYQSDAPAWHRITPRYRAGCDGWAGWWPDPILPTNAFALSARETQPVWLTFRVPPDAQAGEYTGVVRFLSEVGEVASVPYQLRVHDFVMPEAMHLKAIYDARGTGPLWQQPGVTAEETRHAVWRFMAERRLCPDTVKPEPKLDYREGRVVAEFAEFDKAASYYLDTLKLPHLYTPWLFYGFGWGHPPQKRFAEEPYPGQRPFTNAPRDVLRPEYKTAYQACLRAFWSHLKERGWADRCVLYISDEPYDSQLHIREQMKALCAMIREVDPGIPIYCSTWHHQPDWDGHLTVWGLGHDGRVPVEKLRAIRDGGAKVWWTTDGQMCLDTPYCAIERLLPHYCFHYDVDAYEFWGIDWLTYDPYEFGWHRFNRQSGQPGDEHWVRYPNGDGYLIYPGARFGRKEPVSSIRAEQAAEGCEDYEYLWLLRDRITRAKAAGREVASAEQTLSHAAALVSIPNAGGRYSTRILPDPDAVFRAREAVATAIQKLGD